MNMSALTESGIWTHFTAEWARSGELTVLVGAAACLVAWLALRLLARAGGLAHEVGQLMPLIAVALLCEGAQLSLPPAWAAAAPWLMGLQIVVLAALAVRAVVRVYIGAYLEHRRHVHVNLIIRDIIRFLILALFVILFLRFVLQLNLATILTPSAILGAIIGLSMQDTIGNLVAGLVIQIEKPFDLNDWIEIDGKKGQVREINWRYTKIETTDKIYIIIPNNKISSNTVINLSQPTPVLRQFLDIGVSYDVPPFKVKRAVLEVLNSNPNVLDKDASEVFLHDYGASSVNYRIGYAVGGESVQRRIRDEVNSAIWYQFQKLGIEIPYPIQTYIAKPPAGEPDTGDTVAVIGALPFFEGVSRENLTRLARFGLLHVVEAGRVAVRDQAAGDSMFFIIEGAFRVLKHGRPLAELQRGQFFGEMSLLTGACRSADVEAATHGRLLEIDRYAFKVLIESEPLMMRQIERVIEERSQTPKGGPQPDQPPEAKATLLARFKKLFGLAPAESPPPTAATS